MRNLYLVRGLPGAGKTTIAQALAPFVVEADQFFVDPDSGDYNFRKELLTDAHKWCQSRVEEHLFAGDNVAVANTFTKQWEMQPYLNLAKAHGYRVHTIIVENRHGSDSVHGPGAMKVKEKYRQRFEVSL